MNRRCVRQSVKTENFSRDAYDQMIIQSDWKYFRFQRKWLGQVQDR